MNKLKPPSKPCEQICLVIDGCGETLTVALQAQQKTLYHSLKQGFAHNENIVAICEGLLKDAGLSKEDLELIGVNLGPGSFTGQRIALSFTKGLSYALGLPLIGFNTFELWQNYLVWQSSCHTPKEVPWLIVIDGRKRRFYLGLAQGRLLENPSSERESWVLPMQSDYLDLSPQSAHDDLVQQLGDEGLSKLQICGPDAASLLEEFLKLEAPHPAISQVSFFPPPETDKLAYAMLRLSGFLAEQGRFLKASDGAFYLRKSDAEEQRNSLTNK